MQVLLNVVQVIVLVDLYKSNLTALQAAVLTDM